MHCKPISIATILLLIRGLLCFVSVPIIPVYLDIIDKPTDGAPADNSTKNSTFTATSSSVTTDSSMDFKIGALFASKAFVQVCQIINFTNLIVTSQVKYCKTGALSLHFDPLVALIFTPVMMWISYLYMYINK